MLRSVQLEAAARGQERAARARKEKQEAAQRLSAGTTTVADDSSSTLATYAATSTTAGASISTVATAAAAAATVLRLPGPAVDNDVIVRDVPAALKWGRVEGGAPGDRDGGVIATVGKIQPGTGLTDKVSGGSPSPAGNEGTGNSGQAVRKDANGIGDGKRRNAGVTGTRKRRRRRKPTPAVPVGRAEAVQLLRDAVTRFRASQISDEGGNSETPTSDASSSADGESVHVDKDPRTVAVVEFAEIAHRCLGSGFPEIALEVGVGYYPAVRRKPVDCSSGRRCIAFSKTATNVGFVLT